MLLFFRIKTSTILYIDGDKMIRNGIILIVFFLCFFQHIKPISIEAIKKKKVTVYVGGAIEKEGFYTLENGSQINDLLKYLTLKENATIKHLNPAYQLNDNDVIVIKEWKEDYVSITSATLQQLMTLPGIGEKTALAIIEYRETIGFQKLEDLMFVKGISQKKFEKLCEKIIF